MPIVDNQGRLFGRLNLLDAVLGLLILGLIPLAYGAYVLFRTPAPRLTAVEPAAVTKGPNLRVSVRGENLRPFMRVSFGSTQGNSFIFRNTREAIVDLNDMPPGVYDVVLYDESQERSRLTQALTVLEPPLPVSQVILVGTLGNLTRERAATVTAGMTIPGIGELVEVGTPLPETTRVFAGPVLEIPIANAVRLPVALRASCSVRAPQGLPHCAIGDSVLQPTSILLVSTPIGTLPFQIDQLRGLQPLEPVQITVQISTRADILANIQKGDTDHGQWVNPLAAGATVVGIAQSPGSADVRLAAQAQRGSSSWTYGSLPLRAGASFTLRTSRYELQGVVVKIEPGWTAAP